MMKSSSISFLASRAKDKELTSFEAKLEVSLLKNSSMVLDHKYNISCAVKNAKTSERQHYSSLMKKEKCKRISSTRKNETKINAVLLDSIVSLLLYQVIFHLWFCHC